MQLGSAPPSTPGWPYGPVTFSKSYDSWPSPHYKVNLYIQSPANIWFRYIYNTGPGPRWYHVGSGHQTRAYQGCVGIEAFGVNLSDFGPANTLRLPWRGGEGGSGQPQAENADGSLIP